MNVTTTIAVNGIAAMQAAQNSQNEILMIGGAFMIVFVLLLVLVVRALGMYRLNIKKDVRNPSKKAFVRFASFDRKNSVVHLYKNRLVPLQEKAIPYFDPNAYAVNKSIDCYMGVSGKADDDNIVPCGQVLMSGAMANEFSKHLSDEILNTLLNIPSFKLTEEQKRILDAREVGTPEASKKARPFDKDWVMRTFGIIDVKDVNLILQHQKIQVADLHSRTNEFRLKHSSWAARNQILLGFLGMMVVVSICAVILWNASTTNANALQAGGPVSSLASSVQQLVHLLTPKNATTVSLPVNTPT